MTPEDPTLAPEEGWAELPPFLVGRRSFVSTGAGDERIRIRYFRRARDGAIVGKVWFGPGAEGPPGHAHGGSMAAVLDEAMGYAAWAAGHPVLAARITVEFARKLPLGSEVVLEASVEEANGRRVTARGHLATPGGEVHARGEGLFIKVPVDKLGGP